MPAAIDGYRQNLAAGLAAGHRSTVRLAEAVAGQCATWAGNGDGGWFGEFVADAADPALDALARNAAAAYGELATWLRQSYAPAASTEDGVGPERYRVWALAMLGADLDPDESYEWGCGELARLEADKVIECDRILPGADFAAVRDLLLTDPDRAVHGVDAYRMWLQDLVDEATEALAGSQFDIPDALRRCDVGIPPAGTAAAPYYTPPSEDLAVPGRVWFPTLGKESFPMWADVTTAYHEAVPGHHLQFACTYAASLTRAQRLGFQPAYGEGWALYAERLMDELGWFRTPDTRLGFLSSQALRAVRVVVDIGLHLGRRVPAGLPGTGEPWTFDTAVASLRAAGGLTEEFANSEAQRYLAWPAQATCYKLGERTWLAGRAAARAAAGTSFDLRAWHARALALGPLGLDRLEAELAAADSRRPWPTIDAPAAGPLRLGRSRTGVDVGRFRHPEAQFARSPSPPRPPLATGLALLAAIRRRRALLASPWTYIPADQNRDVCRSRNTTAPWSAVGIRHDARAQRESRSAASARISQHVGAPTCTGCHAQPLWQPRSGLSDPRCNWSGLTR